MQICQNATIYVWETNPGNFTYFLLVAVPSMPVGVRVTHITNSSIRLNWNPPLSPNGKLLGYRLYFMKNDNFTDVVTVRMGGEKLDYTLKALGKKNGALHFTTDYIFTFHLLPH